MSLLLLLKGGASGQTLTPSLYTNTQTFFAPTVTPGAVTLTPALFTNAQTFFAPTITASYNIAPSLYSNNQTFYSATISQTGVAQNLQPSLYNNNQTFYSPTVAQIAPVMLFDGHDGDKGKRKRRWDEESEARNRRRAEIQDVFERVVEGKRDVAATIVAPYIQISPKSDTIRVDYDRLLADIDRVERLYREYQELDDEEVLLLL